MHFVMHAFNNHVKVLHDVTPFVLLQQTAGLSDGVVVVVLQNVTPFVAATTNSGSVLSFCASN